MKRGAVILVAVIVVGIVGYQVGRAERGSVVVPDVREMTIRDGASRSNNSGSVSPSNREVARRAGRSSPSNGRNRVFSSSNDRW